MSNSCDAPQYARPPLPARRSATVVGAAVGVADGQVTADQQHRLLGDDLDGHRGVGDIGDGREDHAPCAAGVIEQRVRGVFDVDDTVQRVPPGVAAYRDDVAEQPLHQVERVDGLIDQDSAAAFAGASPPRPGLVVGGVAMPQHGRRATAYRPELAGVEQRPRGPGGRVVPVLQADADLDVRVVARRGDQPVGLGDRVRDRLLDQDADARLQAVDRRRDVLVVRGAHVHDVGAHLVQQLPVAGEPRNAVPAGRGRDPRRVDVADADQVDADQFVDRLQVDDGHVPASDHRGRCHRVTSPHRRSDRPPGSAGTPGRAAPPAPR